LINFYCPIEIETMPLDTARTIDKIEYDALWQEARECGDVAWQWNDFERRQSLPKQLGQGEIRVIELYPGLSIHIATYQYWRPLLLDYNYSGEEGMLLSNFYLAGDRRIISPEIQLEEDREENAGESCLCYFKEG
jgi:AraC family transcriptional activator of pyochelin receptor